MSAYPRRLEVGTWSWNRRIEKDLNSVSIFCEIVKKFEENPNPKLKSAAVKSIYIENDYLFVSHSLTDCQGESKKVIRKKKYIESFAINDRDNDDKEQ